MSCYMSFEIVIKSDKKETVISAMKEFIKRNYCEDEFIDDIKYVEGYYILRKTSFERKLQNSNTTSKDESLCNAIDNALNLLIEADLVL